MHREKKPDDVEIPDALARTVRQLGVTAQNFFVLGELPGMDDFMDKLKDNLRAKGWPVGPTQADPLCDMIEQFKHMRGWQSNVKHELFMWFNTFDDKKQVRHFLVEPKNITALQAAVDDTTAQLAKDWGDPAKVKHGQRSLIKATFAAVSEKIIGADTPERKLCAELKAMTALMKKAYADHNVPSIEFQGRVEEYLDKKGWPIAEPTDIHRCLASRLWSLASGAQSRSSIPMRWELQYSTSPPRTSFREPTEYIMQNIPDIGEAARAVATELNAECKTERGLITRHCKIMGREEYTDFSWSEAKRNQKPKMPEATEKNIKVKAPLQLKK